MWSSDLVSMYMEIKRLVLSDAKVQFQIDVQLLKQNTFTTPGTVLEHQFRSAAISDEYGRNWQTCPGVQMYHRKTTSTTLKVVHNLSRLETLKSASAAFDNVRQCSTMIGNDRQ